MNQQTRTQWSIYKFLKIFKTVPDFASIILLGVRLALHQIDMMRRAWKTPNVAILGARRIGKSYFLAIYAILKCIFFENTKVVITAPVSRQAKQIMRDIENIYKVSGFFRNQCEREMIHGNDEWRLSFLNGSFIVALPFSDKIRSYGANIIIVDEVGYFKSFDEITTILKPMLFNKKNIGKKADEDDMEGNQMIWCCSATYQWNPWFKKVKEFEEEIINHFEKISKGEIPPDTPCKYDLICYDYHAGLESGLYDKDRVIEEFNKADSDTQKTEFLCQFIGGSDGYIPMHLIHNKAWEREMEVEFEYPCHPRSGDPYLNSDGGYFEYILALDDSFQGTDNFAVGLIKIKKNVKKCVRLVTHKNPTLQEKERIIRELFLIPFGDAIKVIITDQAGKTLKDLLAQPYKNSENGKLIDNTIYLDKNDPEQAKVVKREWGYQYKYRSILEMHSFSNESNHERATKLKADIEQNLFKIPVYTTGGYEEFKGKYLNLSEEEVKNAYKEMYEAVVEIVSIVPQPAGKFPTYKPGKRNQQDDRFTVIELGNWRASKYIEENYLQNEEDSTEVVGIWGKGNSDKQNLNDNINDDDDDDDMYFVGVTGRG